MWILIAVGGALVLLLVLLLAVRATRRRRHSARLRARFGPEYETAVHRFGRVQGERYLEELLDRHDARHVRDVSHDERAAALQSLEAVQASFVDSPATAVRAADQLVFDVLRERGYPLESIDARASALAVEEPDLAHRYREAHAALTSADGAGAGADDVGRLRDAFLTYRELLHGLVGAPSVSGRLVTAPATGATDASGAAPTTDPSGPAPPPPPPRAPEPDPATPVSADGGAPEARDAESDGSPVATDSPSAPQEGPWTSTRTDTT